MAYRTWSHVPAEVSEAAAGDKVVASAEATSTAARAQPARALLALSRSITQAPSLGVRETPGQVKPSRVRQ